MDTTDPRIPQQATALAKAPRTIRDLIQSKDFETAVKMALPKHVTVERFMRVALNATMRQPELAECSKESFFLRMLELSALGLEPDGRRAHLIPFNSKYCGNCPHPLDQHQGPLCRVAGCQCRSRTVRKEVQLIIDYKGIAELVRRSGDVSYMHVDAVYEADEWDFTYGSGAFLKHKPNLELEDRGKIKAFYSFVKLADGNEDFIVMPKSKIDAIRKRSKAADAGPWVTDYEEMGKKSCFRNHSKWLPLSSEVKDSIHTGLDVEAIDAGGAMDMAGQMGSGETNEQRLERQMQEQSEHAEETKDVAKDLESERKAEAESEPERKQSDFNPPWQSKAVMRTSFDMLFAQLDNPPAFWQVCGNHAIDSLDNLTLNGKEEKEAFAEILQLIAENTKAEPEAKQEAPGQNQFTFGKSRRDNEKK